MNKNVWLEKIPRINIANNLGHCYILFCRAEVYYPRSSFRLHSTDGEEWTGRCSEEGKLRLAGLCAGRLSLQNALLEGILQNGTEGFR